MSNRPEWKDAPEWANYLCRDDDGTWCWFESKPLLIRGTYCPNKGQFDTIAIKGNAPLMETRPLADASTPAWFCTK